jgi:uncharacterized protein DUF1707/cell wall-active antibiotic response 4TMS protein YvqF
MNEPDVRASDAEREQAVAQLRDAAAEGRLTLDEFSQRVEAAYEAKTHDALESLTADLPTPTAAGPSSRRRPRSFTVSIFGGITRKGRWRVARRHWVVSMFGGSDLDLREASLEGGEATISIVDVFGGTDVYVPDGIEVDFNGFGFFGGADEHGGDLPAHVGAPLLRVRAFSLFGGTDVWRVPRGATGTRKELRRAARAAERQA